MLSFFRKIRHNLLNEGKTAIYFKYAIGEILLVVIGILIALKIDNWNDIQQIKEIELTILKTVTTELETNRAIIQECLKENTETIQAADTIKTHIGPESPSVSIQELYQLFGGIGAALKCKESIAVLEDFKNSGKINIISNEVIRKNISLWFADVKELEKEEDEWSKEFSTQFIPYANKWILWEDVDFYYFSEANGYSKSRFNTDPLLILKQPEFANIMSIHYWRMNRAKRRIESLLEQTTNLLETINNTRIP